MEQQVQRIEAQPRPLSHQNDEGLLFIASLFSSIQYYYLLLIDSLLDYRSADQRVVYGKCLENLGWCPFIPAISYGKTLEFFQGR